MSAVHRYFDRTYRALNYAGTLRGGATSGRLFRRGADRIFGRARQLLHHIPLSSILDLGCGTGSVIAHLAPDHSLTRVVGVDFSARSLAVAGERLDGIVPIRFECAPVQECRALDGRYDAVVSLGLFDYVRLDAALLARMARAAQQVMIITVPRRRPHPQRLIRRAWLALNGVSLLAYDQPQLRALGALLPATEWQVTIEVQPDFSDNFWFVARRR